MGTLKFKAAPLPFQGQKRMFLRQFAEVVAALPDDTVFVDLFGGSGLLSRAAKDLKPSAKVVYNDFDNFRGRVAGIPLYNRMLAELRPLVSSLPKCQRIPTEIKNQMISVIDRYEAGGFSDWVTLSSAVLFSGNWCKSYDDIQKQTWWNSIPLHDYDRCDDYFNGLEVRASDYQELFAEYGHLDNAVFIIDPPYLSTSASSYSYYWSLADYLDVLAVLGGVRFIYFSSAKSHIIPLMGKLSELFGIADPFAGASEYTARRVLNQTSAYTDMMLVNIAPRATVTPIYDK